VQGTQPSRARARVEKPPDLALSKPLLSVIVVDGARSGLAWGRGPPPDLLEGLAGSRVIRVSDGLNVNLRLVARGVAAPYFYAGRRGELSS
jgi:hypothetical protein